jgi:DNA-binding NtrC family response regulator
MHRAVLLCRHHEIGPEAILLSGGTNSAAAVAAAAMGAGATAATPAGEAAGTTQLVGRTVADVERDLILDTVDHCFGNRTHAANILGISIRTLRNKLKLYGSETMVGGPRTEPSRLSA